MKRTFRFFYLLALMLVMSLSANANITKAGGWFEAAYAEWAPVSGATDYVVYVKQGNGSFTQIDKELVRKYPSYYRADVVGLAAGSYELKVVPKINDAEDESKAMLTGSLSVTAHDRNGFAHVGQSGVGAYKNDGTLKDNARILYVWGDNAKTVSLQMQVDAKGKMETRTGLQDIIQAYEKGQEKRPLAVRIIGTVKAADMDAFGSSAEGLQVKGNGSGKCIANLTIEGIGEDAAIHGFGILCRSISSVEFRNFAIMLCMDDCLSLDTDNKNIWIHNMDFFYGGTGGDADQAKGDGTVDIKGKSSHVTVSYNHFYDAGKCSLGGMKSETTDCWMTYHHNWFDHSDSRHPRIRTAFYHVYNNYFDGNAKYGIGVTCGGSSFVESNYFRNCKYPMLSSKQGTDAQSPKGTFSGENGGVIKAYNNIIMNPKQVLYYDGKQTDGVWDAVKVNSRDENVSATAFTGSTSYNAAATTAAIAAVPASAIDDPANIPAIVRGDLGAGRMNHGDVDWKFSNVVEDTNYGVIAELKTAVVNYKSTLVGFADGTNVKNGGAASTVVGGNGQGISQEQNDAVIPEWGAGGDAEEDEDFEEEPFIANPIADADDEMFWVGENAAQTNAYIAEGIITLTNGTATNKDGVIPTCKFNPDYAGNDTYVADHIGALQLGQASAAKNYNDGGSAVFYCPNGVTSFKINVLRTGTIHFKVFKSTDGQNYTEVGKVEDQKAGIATKDFSMAVRDKESKDPVWIKVVNGSTGGLNIHGVYICQLPNDAVVLKPSDLEPTETEKSLEVYHTYQIAYMTSSKGDISFSTSNPNIADVDEDGNVTALAEGTCNITISQAKDDTYKAGSATIKLTVTDNRLASDLAVDGETTRTLNIGETSPIKVTSTAQGSKGIESSNSNIAIVEPDGNGGFVINAIAEGEADITITEKATSEYKEGVVTIHVTVVDPRPASELALTSEATLNLKEEETSQITVSGAAGTVTYKSSNTNVATVNDSGLITAVAAGTATITVTDPGTPNVKGTSKTVTVTVTKDMTGKALVTFNKPTSGKVPVSSDNSLVSFGGTTTYKDGAYGDYSYGVKLETDTEIYLTPSANATITLVFDVASKRSKLDGETITSDAKGEYTFTGTGGTKYTLKKGDAVNLYAVLFDFGNGGTTGGGEEEETSATLIDYPTKKDGVTPKGSSTESNNTIKLANGYVGTVNGVSNTPGNGILLKIDGGFKKGDVITIAGTITVKTVAAGSTQADYDKKIVTTAKIATVEMVGAEPNKDDVITDVKKFDAFGNTNETGVGNSGDQTCTLEADYPELWIIRDGGTTATITKIVVTRPESQEDDTATGISSIISTVDGAIYDLQGRRIAQPVKGQMYIMGGKKLIIR